MPAWRKGYGTTVRLVKKLIQPAPGLTDMRGFLPRVSPSAHPWLLRYNHPVVEEKVYGFYHY